MGLAPVVLFVYNRPDHTRQTVEALQKNELALESDLFIYADGPKKPEHVNSVREVREYIRKVTGFRSVTIVERNENYGLARSIIIGVTEIVSRFGSIIVLEDDLVTSPFFLCFMNDALNTYGDNPFVASVQGYIPPLGIQLPHTFFLRYVGCWGWGTWRRGWNLFEPDSTSLLSGLKMKGLSHEFDVGGYPFTRMLEQQVAGELDSWAIRWHAALFFAEKLSLYSGQSLVQNIGHDGSGIHCNQSSHFDVFLADKAIFVAKENPMNNIVVHNALAAYFRKIHPSLTKKIFHATRQLFKK